MKVLRILGRPEEDRINPAETRRETPSERIVQIKYCFNGT